jgi:4-hydroxyphenylpyruvate dioxygenase-like putative hemolysin
MFCAGIQGDLSSMVHPDGENLLRQETELLEQVPRVLDERRDAGLDGLVGRLEAFIVNCEREHLVPAVTELLRYTGHSCTRAFADASAATYVLSRTGSASLILRSRSGGWNPFEPFNTAPAARTLQNTRLETLVFATPDIKEYVALQKERGVSFLTDTPIKLRYGLFIQTIPSQYTGNSLGFVEWSGERRLYLPVSGVGEEVLPPKPPSVYLNDITLIDHAATRVRATDRNAAILEFISLTNYHYDFAVYVKSLNSVTSVARHGKDDFAMVFTSGITPARGNGEPGPTEKFIRNYGTRVHHIAFRTENIQQVVGALKEDGLTYLLDLVGSEEDGLRQIFSVPSPHTMLVTEYIQRYGDFDGFFTRSNVERLTEATGRQ